MNRRQPHAQMEKAPDILLISVSFLNDEALRMVQMIDMEKRHHVNSHGVRDFDDARLEDAFKLVYKAKLELEKRSHVEMSAHKDIAHWSGILSVDVLQPLLMNKSRSHHLEFPCLQQPAYDEGMFCFPYLLPIEDDLLVDPSESDSSDSIISKKEMSKSSRLNHCQRISILLYNLGQIRVRQHRYSDAYTFFIDSYAMLKQLNLSIDSGNECTLWFVRILHNFGYIQYRLGDNAASLHIYTAALQALGYSESTSDNTDIAQDKRLCNEDAMNLPTDKAAMIAATLNCMGVLFFHLPHCDILCASECFLETLSRLQTLVMESPQGDVMQLEAGSREGMLPLASMLATALYNMGRVHLVMGTHDLAQWSLLESLQMRRQHLGDDHLDVAATLFNLGQVQEHGLENYDAAIRYYDGFIQIARPILGAQHRDVAFVHKCIAQVCEKQKNFAQAIEAYHAVLIAYRGTFGMNHLEVASILNKLGLLYSWSKCYDLALLMYEQGLKIEQIVLPPNHPNLAVTLSNLAQIHQMLGNLPQSWQLYEQAYEIQIRSSSSAGTSDLSVANTLSHMAVLQYLNRDYEAAMDLYQEVLRIRGSVYGDNTLEMASTWHSIGHVLYRLRCVSMALNSFRHCLVIRRRHLAATHPDVAVNLYNIATIEIELGHEDRGLRCLQELLWIEQNASANGRATIPTLQRIGHLHQQRGDTLNAMRYFQQVVHRLCEWEYPVVQSMDVFNISSSVSESRMLHEALHCMAVLHLEVGNGGGYVDCLTKAWRVYYCSRNGAFGVETVSVHSCCRDRHLGAGCPHDGDMVRSTVHCEECQQGFRGYDMAKLHPESAAVA